MTARRFASQGKQKTAALAPAGDVDGFAEAIEKLLADDAERNRRAEALFDIAQELDWEATAKRFVHWFQKNRPQ